MPRKFNPNARKYSLFLRETDEQGKRHYTRVWLWDQGTPFPAYTLDQARIAFQSWLLLPFMSGWPTVFELRPVKET